MMSVFSGGVDAFDALLYPPDNPINLDYFQRSINSLVAPIGAVGEAFVNSIKNTYDRFYSSDAMQAARNALRMAQEGGHRDPRHIHMLTEVEDIQTAPMIMQRWIMAQPDIRALFHKQQCYGFADTYVDVEPDRVGEEHYDYRRVMNNILQVDEESDWKIVQYLEELAPGDRELSLDEKADILGTWDVIEMFTKAYKDDLTDPYGGML